MSLRLLRVVTALAAAAGIATLASMSASAQILGAAGQSTRVYGFPEAYELGAIRQVGPIWVVPIRKDRIYMLATPQGNSTVAVGPDGAVVVDTLTAELAPSLLEAIKTLSLRPILQIINTSAGGVGGNEVISKGGVSTQRQRGTTGAGIMAFEAVLNRVSADGTTVPRPGWPTDTYYQERKDIYLNGEGIILHHQPGAYSDGDTIVHFRASDVVSAGGIYRPGQYPRIDDGGSINGIVAGLNHIIELTVPEIYEEGGTMVVPAVGRLTDEGDVQDYRDMVTIVRDRIQEMVRKRMTLAQIKAARPTRDYDSVYSTSSYTGDMFIEAVHRSLVAAATPAAAPSRRGAER